MGERARERGTLTAERGSGMFGINAVRREGGRFAGLHDDDLRMETWELGR